MTCASPSFRPRIRYTSSRASMHATTATCLLGGSGSGPEKFFAYSSLFFRYSSVTVIPTSLLARKSPDDNNTTQVCHESKSQRFRRLLGGAQVVDRCPADIGRREVRFHPRGDLRCGTRVAMSWPELFARDEVSDLMLGNVILELRQRGRVVAAGEAADRHDRGAGLEFQITRAHGADSGCGPAGIKP